MGEFYENCAVGHRRQDSTFAVIKLDVYNVTFFAPMFKKLSQFNTPLSEICQHSLSRGTFQKRTTQIAGKLHACLQ